MNFRSDDRRFTILIAHPDDEVLFCWPALGRARTIICASSDLNNPERVWCRERRSCLQEICRRVGAELVCFDYSSDFYRLPTRDGQFKQMTLKLQKALLDAGGPVFTHNPWGEYGHLDHIVCNQIAMSSGLEVWTTSIAFGIPEWLPVCPWIETKDKLQIADELFTQLRAVYEAKGCWTWSFEPALSCGVARIQ